jgi:hypothetical protein
MAMRRLEMLRVRRCQRCGRGRAELGSDDGAVLTVPLDPPRAEELVARDAADETPRLAAVVLDLLAKDGWTVRDVVLDTAAHGLQALVTRTRADEVEVIAATAQEGVSLAVRGTLPMYATDEALAPAAESSDPGDHGTLH